MWCRYGRTLRDASYRLNLLAWEDTVILQVDDRPPPEQAQLTEPGVAPGTEAGSRYGQHCRIRGLSERFVGGIVKHPAHRNPSMVRITVLADNTVGTVSPQGLRGEWGFSVAIDDVLLDTGQTGVAFDNAELLGMHPGFDTVVLSHGHFDHTGGLRRALRYAPTIYAHPEVWRERYKDDMFTGMPLRRQVVEHEADVVEHRDPIEVAPGIHALGEIPRPYKDNPSGRTPRGGGMETDTIPDDQSVVVEVDGGLAVVMGCCHAGVRNTIEYAEETFDEQVRAVIGGTHLSGMDADGVADVVDWMAGRLDLVAASHCTGFEAEARLARVLPDEFESIGVGSTIDL